MFKNADANGVPPAAARLLRRAAALIHPGPDPRTLATLERPPHNAKEIPDASTDD